MVGGHDAIVGDGPRPYNPETDDTSPVCAVAAAHPFGLRLEQARNACIFRAVFWVRPSCDAARIPIPEKPCKAA